MPLSVEMLNECLLVRFVRPEIRNPLSVEVVKRLHALFDSFKAGVDFMRIVFTGADEVFASGADLREIDRLDSEDAREFAHLGQSLMNKIAGTPLITIAAINGYCFGGGLDLALACNRRIATSNAVFSHPGAGLGIITGWGGTQRLPQLIGEAAALELLLTAGRFDSQWALRTGLVEAIDADPLERAIEFDH
jgi:enoyl-CoA hydratase